MKKTKPEDIMNDFKVGNEQRMRIREILDTYPAICDIGLSGTFAAIYLVTVSDNLFKKVKNCFFEEGLDLGYAKLGKLTTEEYSLFLCAKELNNEKECVMLNELCDPYLIEDKTLAYIINAILIARCEMAF